MWRTLTEAVRGVAKGCYRVVHNAALVAPTLACKGCGNQAYTVTDYGDWKCTNCEVITEL